MYNNPDKVGKFPKVGPKLAEEIKNFIQYVDDYVKELNEINAQYNKEQAALKEAKKDIPTTPKGKYTHSKEPQMVQGVKVWRYYYDDRFVGFYMDEFAETSKTEISALGRGNNLTMTHEFDDRDYRLEFSTHSLTMKFKVYKHNNGYFDTCTFSIATDGKMMLNSETDFYTFTHGCTISNQYTQDGFVKCYDVGDAIYVMGRVFIVGLTHGRVFLREYKGIQNVNADEIKNSL